MRPALPLLALAIPLMLAPPGRPQSPSNRDIRDSRLGKIVTLDDYFPFTPPRSREEWQKRRRQVREQVLVANGLWPMLPKTPINPVIHGKINRDEYTIEKVFFASLPGHYVSGNLYRPKGKEGKLPAILCPHGHWQSGRMYKASDGDVQRQMEQGAEQTAEGARYPLQARCAQLARMGCVVFFYDMVGNADSKQIAHREGFTDAEAELRLQSFMGLQTWNSLRALDFLLSLPDVDPSRVGVTGASGGGTQTFILGAIDDRPAAAFPAVMVCTAMQGGCVCENCSHLRVGSGNIELAGLFAPRPLGMTGADDWTLEIQSKGLPELKKLYALFGAEDKVTAECFPQFGHNYNQVSREVMYNFFNKHLKLGQPEPVVERPFVRVSPNELSVYDKTHPLPTDATDARGVRQYLTEVAEKQMAVPKEGDKKAWNDMRGILRTALRVMVHDTLPASSEVEDRLGVSSEEKDGLLVRKMVLSRKGKGEAVNALGVCTREFDGTAVVWVHPDGVASLWRDGKLVPAAQRILDRKAGILAIDAFLTGETASAKARPVNAKYAGFTFGYNRSLLAERVHDILTAVAFARGFDKTKKVHLAGFGKAGPWVLLARGLCDDAVARTAADMNRFRFDGVESTADEMMLPGALRYGGLGALASLCGPHELFVYRHGGTSSGRWLRGAYAAAGAEDALRREQDRVSDERVVDWLLR
jgi:dienelactone hydrolase